MSRMYDNKPLENLPVYVTKWNGTFDNDFAKTASSKNNPGVLCDGKIVSQARININSSDPTASQARYYILFTSVERAHRRKYDDKGVEEEPNFSKTTKVSTGYLNSSYDVKAKGNTDRLAVDEVRALVNDSKINDMMKEVVAKESRKGDVVLLMKEEERLKVDLQENSLVRLKTAGDSPLIESLIVRDDLTSTVGNFAGDEKMGDSWLEKIVAAKAAKSAEEQPSEIADEEWDD
ncbi:C15orf38-ap3s2 readthrough [Plakobranchus ocellatus]|uniref:Arpin n=1 Tax=Plakobranchus ocellatus TaxID=259542 RepID=A0AAV4A7P7_9GAST|nr:C15orf38-ap3s2 readthrough [Plakobranchus ocellatus]